MSSFTDTPVHVCSLCNQANENVGLVWTESKISICDTCLNREVSMDIKWKLKHALRSYPAHHAEFFRQIRENPEGMILVDKKEYYTLIAPCCNPQTHSDCKCHKLWTKMKGNLCSWCTD